MKKFFIFFQLSLPFLLCGLEQDLPHEAPSLKDPKELINLQLQSLDLHMAMSRLTLEKMGQLKTSINNYQAIQKLYLERPKDKEILFRMTKLADHILREIKSAKLTHVFDCEFISELNMMAKIYRKNQLPKL